MSPRKKTEPRSGIRARLPAMPSPLVVIGWGLAAILVGVSGLMSISYGWSLGEPSGMGYVFAALAAAVTGIKALGLSITFGRGHRTAGFYVLPLVLFCFCYAVTAGHQFAAENLFKAANKVTGANTAYETLRERIEGVRGELKAITEARDVEVIKSEIRRLLLTPGADDCSEVNGPVTKKICPDVAALRTAQAVAEKRDRLKGDLDNGVKKLSETPSSAGVSREAGPVAALIGRITGYEFASLEEFMAWLIVLIVELGDITLPLAMTMAARPSARRVREAREVEVEKVVTAQTILGAGKTAKEIKREQDIAECQVYLDGWTTRDQNAQVIATDFHGHYAAVCAAEGRTPLRRDVFGQIMTRELKLAKIKNNHWKYVGIKLKPLPAVAAAKPKLRAVK